MPLFRFEGEPQIGQKPIRQAIESIHIWGNNPHGVEIAARRTLKGRGGNPDSFLSQVHLATAGGYFFTEVCVLHEAPEQKS